MSYLGEGGQYTNNCTSLDVSQKCAGTGGLKLYTLLITPRVLDEVHVLSVRIKRYGSVADSENIILEHHKCHLTG